MTDRIMTPDEVAARWRSSPGAVRKLLRTGALKGFRVGTAWRVKREAVEEYECALQSTEGSGQRRGERAGQPAVSRSGLRIVALPSNA